MHVFVDGLIVAYESHFLNDKSVINDIDSKCLLGKVSPICHRVYTEKVWFIRSCGNRERRYKQSYLGDDSLASGAPGGM